MPARPEAIASVTSTGDACLARPRCLAPAEGGPCLHYVTGNSVDPYHRRDGNHGPCTVIVEYNTGEPAFTVVVEFLEPPAQGCGAGPERSVVDIP